jgi:apolipoprotein N-acyltransferase
MTWCLAALSGALCIIVAFPTMGWAPLALVAWTPLLIVSRGASWRRRLLFGWLMGFASQAILFRWIVFTAREMSGLPTAAGIGLLVVFSLWHGLMSGVFLALSEPARRRALELHPGLGPLGVALLYAAVEWMWPMLFPWGLGHAFWEVGPVMTLAAFTGAPGLSFGVMLVSAAAALVITQGSGRGIWPSALVLVLLASMAGGWWLHLEATPPRRTLSVGVIQMNYTLEEKRGATLERRKRLMGRFDERLRSIRPGRFDLLVASEGAFPLFWDLDVDSRPEAGRPSLATSATRAVQEALAAGPKTHLISGGLRRSPTGRLVNSALHFTPDGRVAGHYDKRLLVPFGETMPLSDWFPALKGAVRGVGDFAGGSEPCAFEAAGEAVACGICYESIFPGFTRETAGDDASLLVNLTIDVWFGRSTAPWFHLMVQSTRAAELGIPLVRAALTGISAVVGADGAPTHLLPLDEEGVLEAQIGLREVTTPYRVVGPLFGWLCLAGALGLLISVWRGRERVSGSGGSGVALEGDPKA